MKTRLDETNYMRRLMGLDLITEGLDYSKPILNIGEEDKYGAIKISGFISFPNKITEANGTENLTKQIKSELEKRGYVPRKIKSLTATGGASNYFKGPTKAEVGKVDVNNPRKTIKMVYDTSNLSDDLKKTLDSRTETNKTFAEDRVNIFKDIILKNLSNGKEPTYPPNIKYRIYNTGGKIDEERVEETYPVPGQNVEFIIDLFVGKKPINIVLNDIFKQTKSFRKPAGNPDNPGPNDGYGKDEKSGLCTILVKNADFGLAKNLPEYKLETFQAKLKNNQIVRTDGGKEFSKIQWAWIKWYLQNDENRWKCNILSKITNLPPYFDKINLENIGFGAVSKELEFVHDKSKHDNVS